MRLKIKRLDPAVGLPEPASGRAAGFDLASAVDLEIPPRSIRLVGTGLVISVLTGIFSGLAPAWAASKLDPVVALRYE